ncbi:MAG: DUF1579 family protein [Planctomycetes bacterium]|nr:DUF1579 family protein [Planctomycetota bacterium]
MTDNGGLEKLAGAWKGSNRLWEAPNAPPSACDATAVVSLVAQGKFTCIQYTWCYDGKPQDGMLLIGRNEKTAEAKIIWVDSWHMDRKMMTCAGKTEDGGEVVVRGAYAAPPGPDWGWKIGLKKAADDAFQIMMHNISPEGKEELAVEMKFKR